MIVKSVTKAQRRNCACYNFFLPGVITGARPYILVPFAAFAA